MTLSSEWVLWCLMSRWVVVAVITAICVRKSPAILIIITLFLAQYFSAIKVLPQFGLQNSLAGIHPTILLAIYAILVLFGIGYCNVSLRGGYLYVVSILALTIALGGLWAFQEYTWGGWWNWDSVETPSAVLWFFLLLYFIHGTPLTTVLTAKWHYLSILVVLLNTFMVRYSDSGSVHAFTSSLTNYSLYYGVGWITSPSTVTLLRSLLSSFPAYTFGKKILLTFILVVARTFFLLKSKSQFTYINLNAHVCWLVLVTWCLSLNWNYIDVFKGTSAGLYFKGLWVKPQTFVLLGSINHLTYLMN